MAEIKTLSDFYDPTRSGLGAMNYLAGQQHLAVQQQQVDLQAKNQQIDNLQKALDAGDPLQSYPIYKQRNEMLGLPVDPVNDYIAKLPYSRHLRAAQKLNEQVGLGSDPDLASLTADKPAVATQVAGAAVDPVKQMAQVKNQEHAAVVAEHAPELKVLNAFTQHINLGVSTHAPMVEKLQGITEQADKLRRSKGSTAATGTVNELIAADPELAKFKADMAAAIPKAQEQIAAIKQQRAALDTRLLDIAAGVDTPKDGESLALLTGQGKALAHTQQFYEAALAFNHAPTPSNLAAMEGIGASMEARRKELVEKNKLSSEGRLELATRKFETQTREEAAQSYGQDKYLAYVAQGMNKNTAARRALTDTGKAHPGVTIDQSKFKDLEEAGQAHEDKRQASYTSAVKLAASLSGNSGMKFTTGADGQAQFEMGTITDPVALGKALQGLAEDQSDLLHGSVKKALLSTATRLSGKTASAAPAGKSSTNPEAALREKLGLK